MSAEAAPQSAVEQASELVRDDIASWIGNPFMTPEMLTGKAAFWVSEAHSECIKTAADLLGKVVDYWEGRPLTHHGEHIYADLRDVLLALTPADGEESR